MAPNFEQRSSFRGDIQGLRALAVGAVVLYHAGIPFLLGGYVGVDIFFVISGFLITSHLYSSLRGRGRIDFAAFYAKRARRILPASLVVLAVSVLAAVAFYPPLLMSEVWSGAVATALYVPNYLFANDGTNYLAEATPSLFQHYWSLGVEEQFYLVWPVLLLLGFRFVKRSRVLFGVIGALVVVSFALCVVLTMRSQPWAFFSLPTRAWEFGIGGLTGLLLTHRPALLGERTAAAVGWLALGVLAACVTLFSSSTVFPGYWALAPVLATSALLISGASTSRLGPSRVLSARGMLFVGEISYSLYLVHWPLLLIPQAAIGYQHPIPAWATFALVLAGVPIAWALFRWVEQPGRNGRWLAGARPRRTLAVALTASAVVCLLATAALTYSNAKPLFEDRDAARPASGAEPLATSFVPANLTPSLREAHNNEPELYADGCHLSSTESKPKSCVFGDPDLPKVVLFGDSHAAQWFPALQVVAKREGLALETYTKSACPSIAVHVLRNNTPYSGCDRWRAAVIKIVNKETSVALVVLSNYGEIEFEHTGSEAATWKLGLESTIKSISAPSLVLGDTPRMGSAVNLCLSVHLADTSSCSVPLSSALSSSILDAELEGARDSHADYVSFNDLLCDELSCPGIIGNVLVYRDEHHLTTSASALMAGPLDDAIERSLAH